MNHVIETAKIWLYVVTTAEAVDSFHYQVQDRIWWKKYLILTILWSVSITSENLALWRHKISSISKVTKAKQRIYIIQNFRSSGPQKRSKNVLENFVWKIRISFWRIPTEKVSWGMFIILLLLLFLLFLSLFLLLSLLLLLLLLLSSSLSYYFLLT